MIILGIDPGTHRIGYGVIRAERKECSYVDAGLLSVSSEIPHIALRDVKRALDRLIRAARPEGIAIEKLYFSKNRRTGIAVAQARGVILLSAAEHNLPVAEFGPSEVKAHLTGYGLADKIAVAKMVRLALRCPALDVIDDASDALALALAAHLARKF